MGKDRDIAERLINYYESLGKLVQADGVRVARAHFCPCSGEHQLSDERIGVFNYLIRHANKEQAEGMKKLLEELYLAQ